jgi:hypothetical protein
MMGVTMTADPAAPEEADATPTATAERLAELITSSWISSAIHAGIELGLFDALADGPDSVDRLAGQLACAPVALHQLLHACESLQLCQADAEGRYRATAMGRMLASRTPGSQRAWAVLWSRELAGLWTGLAESIRHGASVRSLRGVAAGFGRLADDPVRADAFNQAMTANTWWVAEAFARSRMLEGCAHVIDVGGGHGALALALLREHRAMRATVYDLAHAAAGADAALATAGVSERAQFVAGDFFASVPEGGDAYVLKSVLHDWPDEACARILASCRRAMSGTARLFVIERLATLPLAATSSDRAWARSDLNMLVAHGACERTKSMFDGLLKAAGFRIEKIHALSMGLACIEAHLNA